jgi:hypothetical protein
MLHTPKAQDALNRDGNINKLDGSGDSIERWEKYVGRCFSQLEWWAEACANQKEVRVLWDESPVFITSPSLRKAYDLK